MLYVEVMYHFNEQVDFKISSKLIQASKGLYIAYIIIIKAPNMGINYSSPCYNNLYTVATVHT